jgi:hypothetical protein
MAASTPWLPVETWEHVLCFPFPGELGACALVCSEWNEIVKRIRARTLARVAANQETPWRLLRRERVFLRRCRPENIHMSEGQLPSCVDSFFARRTSIEWLATFRPISPTLQCLFTGGDTLFHLVARNGGDEEAMACAFNIRKPDIAFTWRALNRHLRGELQDVLKDAASSNAPCLMSFLDHIDAQKPRALEAIRRFDAETAAEHSALEAMRRVDAEAAAEHSTGMPVAKKAKKNRMYTQAYQTQRALEREELRIESNFYHGDYSRDAVLGAIKGDHLDLYRTLTEDRGMPTVDRIIDITVSYDAVKIYAHVMQYHAYSRRISWIAATSGSTKILDHIHKQGLPLDDDIFNIRRYSFPKLDTFRWLHWNGLLEFTPAVVVTASSHFGAGELLKWLVEEKIIVLDNDDDKCALLIAALMHMGVSMHEYVKTVGSPWRYSRIKQAIQTVTPGPEANRAAQYLSVWVACASLDPSSTTFHPEDRPPLGAL